MIKIFLALVVLNFGFSVSADLFCAKADHVCVDPIDGSPVITNETNVRFCTINADLNNEELKQKLSYYQRCNYINGVVKTENMNKTK